MGLLAPDDLAAPLGYGLLWHLAQESAPLRNEVYEIFPFPGAAACDLSLNNGKNIVVGQGDLSRN